MPNLILRVLVLFALGCQSAGPSPTSPHTSPALPGERLRQYAQKQLELMQKARPFCILGVAVNPRLYIYALSEEAERAAVQKGDRVIAVGTKRINTEQEWNRARMQVVAGREVPITIERDGEEITRTVRCHDGEEAFLTATRVYEAVVRADWDECAVLARNVIRANRLTTSSWLSIRSLCLQEKAVSERRRLNVTEAQALYEADRLKLQEATYQPDGLDSIRGRILTTITLLNNAGFLAMAADLEDQLRKARPYHSQVRTKKSDRPSQATAFAVRPDGVFLTAFHVVDGAKSITLKCPDRQPLEATVGTTSRNTDLATLEAPAAEMPYLSIGAGKAVRAGDPVFTIGFPAADVLGSEPKFTEGSVSAVSGPSGEASFIQISVPVQPGNSGGPLLDSSGFVVGIVTSSAAAIAFLKATGALPQNVSWAVKAEYAKVLVGDQPARPAVQTRVEAIELAKRATCLVRAIRTP